ncbi:hypothetical protein FQZ97_672800 [compost metagenome]
MLVVDLHALQTVHVLHFVDDVGRQLLDALQAQDVVGIGRAVHDHFALVHDLAVVHQHLLFLRNQELVAHTFQVGDDQALLALGVLAERDRAGDVGQHAGVLRRTGFEQLGHTRQTAGNVAGLLRFLRNTRQDFTHSDLLAVAHGDQRANRERDVHRMVGAGDLDVFAVLVDQLDLRTHDDLAATGLGRDDDERRQAGNFVHLLGNGHALFDVLEADGATVFRHDRTGQRIPRRQTGASLHGFAIAHQHGCAVRDLVAFAFAAVVVEDRQFAGARDRHAFALGVGDVAHRAGKAHGTAGLGFHRAGQGRTRRRATDVERTHRELRARFADGLGGDDANRFALVDRGAAAEIAAVAVRAQAVTRFARQRRADLDFVHADAVNGVDQVFVQQGAGDDGRFLRVRVDDVNGSHAAQDAVAQRFDDFAAFDQGFHVVALRGAAIVFGNDQVLRHVDQTTGQVARVGGLQRRIGQTLTRAVSRDEVLEYVQAFTEVRGNRRFDNGAVRLGHQAAHTGQLADLGRATAGTRVGHHVDGVERLLIHFLAVAIGGLLLGQLGHHDLGDLVTGLAPDVHHLVVALARGHQTGSVLLGDFLHLVLGAVDDGRLLLGHQHVVHGDRDTGAGGQTEAVLQQLVGKHTVSFRPHLRNEVLIRREISFFFSALFSTSKGRPRGRISESRARPTVVSTSVVDGVHSPVALSSVCWVRRTLILAVISTTALSSARCSSDRSAKIMPSPLALMRSRVA